MPRQPAGQQPEIDRLDRRVPPYTRGDYALRAIHEDLITGRLAAGDSVSAEQMALDLGISHVPVREALRFLEAQGHLVRDHRGRLRVRATSVIEAEEIYRLRRMLEKEVHDDAVPRLTDGDLQAVEDALRAMDAAMAARDMHAFARANRTFHFRVFERTGREWMLRFLAMIWDAAARYQTDLFVGSGWEAELQDQHRRLMDAFRRRDVEAVHRLMDDHRRLAIDEAHRRATSQAVPGQTNHRPVSENEDPDDR